MNDNESKIGEDIIPEEEINKEVTQENQDAFSDSASRDVYSYSKDEEVLQRAWRKADEGARLQQHKGLRRQAGRGHIRASPKGGIHYSADFQTVMADAATRPNTAGPP